MTEAKGDSAPTFAVEVNNMCFDYRQKKNVLKNVSLKLQPGSRCLLVGDNGAGTFSFPPLSLFLTHHQTHTNQPQVKRPYFEFLVVNITYPQNSVKYSDVRVCSAAS